MNKNTGKCHSKMFQVWLEFDNIVAITVCCMIIVYSETLRIN